LNTLENSILTKISRGRKYKERELQKMKRKARKKTKGTKDELRTNCKRRQKERYKMLTKEIGANERKIVASMMIEGQKDRRQ
jgi:hypothetical protein